MKIERIDETASGLVVSGAAVGEFAANIAVLAVGVKPNTELGSAAGIRSGFKGALCVNRRMQTNVEGIYAAGDCAETWHRVICSNTWLPLGTTSHKQGRVAGENAVGGNREFQGSLGTQVVKVFDLAVFSPAGEVSAAALCTYSATVSRSRW